jgi:hypothetical protein
MGATQTSPSPKDEYADLRQQYYVQINPYDYGHEIIVLISFKDGEEWQRYSRWRSPVQ